MIYENYDKQYERYLDMLERNALEAHADETDAYNEALTDIIRKAVKHLTGGDTAAALAVLNEALDGGYDHEQLPFY